MKTTRRVYLDHSATTPTDERVVAAMMPYFSEMYGNSSSSHSFGRSAENAIEDAREVIADVLNCKPAEIIFTSGGTESDNLAVRGAAWGARTAGRGQHLITTPVEHSAVTRTVSQLSEMMGFESTLLPVDHAGLVDPEVFAGACHEGTTFASVIYGNNEIGSISPIPQLADLAHERGVILHTDAVQAAGQLTVDVETLGVDMMSISAHKFYGPKGVGALYVREGVELVASQSGGSHESGRRSGTHNTPFIVGMAEALRLAHGEIDERTAHYRAMRDLLIDGILARTSDVELSGHPQQRLPSHASFVFDGVDSSMLLMHLDMQGVAASGGSACKTGNPEPSSVLLALGYPPERAIGSLRLSVGRCTSVEDVEYAVGVIEESVEKVRKLRREFLL